MPKIDLKKGLIKHEQKSQYLAKLANTDRSFLTTKTVAKAESKEKGPKPNIQGESFAAGSFFDQFSPRKGVIYRERARMKDGGPAEHENRPTRSEYINQPFAASFVSNLAMQREADESTLLTGIDAPKYATMPKSGSLPVLHPGKNTMRYANANQGPMQAFVNQHES